MSTVDALLESRRSRRKLDVLEDVIAWRNRRQEMILADDAEIPPFGERRYAVVGTQLILWVFTHSDGEHCEMWVLAEDELSYALDGAKLVPREGESVQINRGQATCQLSAILNDDFDFLTKDGTRLILERQTQ